MDKKLLDKFQFVEQIITAASRMETADFPCQGNSHLVIQKTARLQRVIAFHDALG